MKPDRLERTVRRLIKAGRRALQAQRAAFNAEAAYDNGAGTKRVAARTLLAYGRARAALDSAEVDVEEALQPWNRM